MKIQDYTVILDGVPEISWILEGKPCIRLYALQDICILPKEVKIITFGRMSYEMSRCIGIPYIKKQDNIHKYNIYYSEFSFGWKDKDIAKLVLYNPNSEHILISKGEYLGSVRFMSREFFSLWKRHDGSDKGLQSVPIKIITK